MLKHFQWITSRMNICHKVQLRCWHLPIDRCNKMTGGNGSIYGVFTIRLHNTSAHAKMKFSTKLSCRLMKLKKWQNRRTEMGRCHSCTYPGPTFAFSSAVMYLPRVETAAPLSLLIWRHGKQLWLLNLKSIPVGAGWWCILPHPMAQLNCFWEAPKQGMNAVTLSYCYLAFRPPQTTTTHMCCLQT